MKLKVVTSQYPLVPAESWQEFQQRMIHRVAQLSETQAEIILLPEYGSLELGSMLVNKSDFQDELFQLQQYADDVRDLFSRLAQTRNHVIIAPSFLYYDKKLQGYVNRVWVCFPDGSVEYQDKIHLTQFEHNELHLLPGESLRTFEWQGVTFAVAICYDSEFPAQISQLTQAGAQLILVPSSTETEAGMNRVNLSCRARAIENQCFIAVSPLRGEGSWSEIIDTNVGTAAIYSPIDVGFPDDGILAQASKEGNWAVAELDFNAVDNVRRQGQVLNFEDLQRTIPDVIPA